MKVYQNAATNLETLGNPESSGFDHVSKKTGYSFSQVPEIAGIINVNKFST